MGGGYRKSILYRLVYNIQYIIRSVSIKECILRKARVKGSRMLQYKKQLVTCKCRCGSLIPRLVVRGRLSYQCSNVCNYYELTSVLPVTQLTRSHPQLSVFILLRHCLKTDSENRTCKFDYFWLIGNGVNIWRWCKYLSVILMTVLLVNIRSNNNFLRPVNFIN